MVANLIIAQLLFLEAEDPEKDIHLYINSPGGSTTAGLAIYDTMQLIRPDVQTICVGQAASMGAVLLAAGTQGKRFALPNSRILIHQPWGGAQGQASDIAIQAKEILRIKDRLNQILAQHTKQPLEKIVADADRDFIMDAEQAKDYGIVDHVIMTSGSGAKMSTTKKAGAEGEVLRCSFCNKDQNDVRKLIAGPTVFICDECVDVCNDIIADDRRVRGPPSRSRACPRRRRSRSSSTST